VTTSDALRTLRLRELPDLLRSVVVAGRTEIALRREPLDVVARRCGARLRTRPPATDPDSSHLTLTAAERSRLVTARRVTRHWPFGDTCLRRSLMTAHHLRDRSPELCVGVAKNDGVVTAHAWLVVDGVDLDPTGSAQFAILETTDGSAR
jgi:hypothetical protein